MMPNPEPLFYGHYYHIYNRGNSGEELFRESRNYPYFLNLYTQYVEPVAETYAYCLLSNHFHFMVRIRDVASRQTATDGDRSLEASRALSNLFGTYTKAFNKAFQRTGSLFEKPFKRSLITKDTHFASLIVYIHRNPQGHGFVEDFRTWPYSSYRSILSQAPTRLPRATVLDCFQGRAGFKLAHTQLVDESQINWLVADDRI